MPRFLPSSCKRQSVSFSGLGGQRKRRRACDIEERPFKCRHPDCSAHAGFTIRSGLDRHRRKKHPGDTSAVPEREGTKFDEDATSCLGKPPMQLFNDLLDVRSNFGFWGGSFTAFSSRSDTLSHASVPDCGMHLLPICNMLILQYIVRTYAA